MNAIKFIKEHGVDKAREVVEGAPKGAELFHTNTYIKNAHSEGRTDHFARWSDGFKGWVNASADREFIDESIVLEELKRLVESVDIIKELGGIHRVKRTYKSRPFELAYSDLKQAIADYEEIYKCTYCNGFGEVGCQFEGTFTCPDCNGDRYVGGEHV